MRWLRYVIRTLNVLAGLLVIVLCLGAWLLASESGSAWIVRTVAERAAPALSIGSIDGTLLDTLVLENVAYVTPDNQVEIDGLTASIALGRLIVGELVVEDLGVSEIRYRGTGEASSEAAPRTGPPPSAPIAVIVETAVIDGIRVATPGSEIVFGRLGFAARFAGSDLSLERFDTTFSGFEVSGRLALTLAEAIGIEGSASWGTTFDGEQYLGQLELSGTLPVVAVEHSLYAPYSVETTGNVVLEERPRVDLEFTWQDVAPARYDFVSSRSGSAHVTGRLDNLEFAANGNVEAFERSLDFDGNGVLDGTIVELERMRVSGAEGELVVDGEIALDTLEWSFTVDGRRLDPSAFVRDWPGEISAAGDVTGRFAPSLAVATDDLRLEGSVRGQPFEARLRGSLDGTERGRIDELVVTAGDDRFEVSGEVGRMLDLAVNAEVNDLEAFAATLSGGAHAALTVTGDLSGPVVSGTAELDDVAYGRFSVGTATVSGSGVAAPDGRIDLALVGGPAVAGALTVDRFEGRLTGTLGAHTATLDLTAEDWSGAAAATGALTGPRWRGVVQSLELDQALVGVWQLAEPAALTAGPGTLVLASSCLEQAASTVCAEIRLTGARDDGIRVSANDFDVRTLDPFLPEMVDVAGLYQLDADFTGLGGDPSGSLTLTGDGTELTVSLEDGQAVGIALTEVDVRAALEGWALAVNVDVAGRDAGRFNVVLGAADLRTRDSEIQGRVEAFWPDVGVLSLLSPDVGAVTGTLGVDLRVSGTRAEPELMGEARWDGGSVELSQWGVRVESIEGRATSADARTLEFTGTGDIDGQEVSVTGSTELDPERNWPTRLSLRGDDLPLVQLTDAEVVVSPALDVVVALPRIEVEGSVHVPRANIALEELPSQAVRPSSDIVVHGETAIETAARPLDVHAELAVTLGDDVHYSGSNLMTDVTGSMRLVYDSGGTTNAVGTLNAAGSYDAYGQALDLDRGELLFSGPLDDPNLDIRAVRRVGAQTVGVELTGSLRAPRTRIFSEPSLSEADALSYLMFGRPLSGTGEQETATLESAAVAMGLQQALPVVQRIGQTLGFDEFSIETTDVDAGALMAGKYLSPKLYIRYSYGLFNRIGGLLLRYKINERLSIETRSGDQKSMDLLYTVEKD